MLVTLTTDFGKLLDGMHRTKIRGTTHLATAIQIAGVCCLLHQISGNIIGLCAELAIARTQASSK